MRTMTLSFIFPLGRKSPQRSPATTFFLCLLSTFLTLSSSWLNSPISKTPALGHPPTCSPESLLGCWGLSLCGLTSYHCLSMHGPNFYPSNAHHQKPPVPHKADAIPASSTVYIFCPCHPQPGRKAPHSSCACCPVPSLPGNLLLPCVPGCILYLGRRKYPVLAWGTQIFKRDRHFRSHIKSWVWLPRVTQRSDSLLFIP